MLHNHVVLIFCVSYRILCVTNTLGVMTLKGPRIKQALLCRFLIYTLILGVFALPIVLVFTLPFCSDTIRIIVLIASLVGLLIYLIKNFGILLTMDVTFALLNRMQLARKRFVLPTTFSAETVEKRLSRYGIPCDPIAYSPSPTLLQYKNKYPLTSFSSGIECVIVTYHTPFLDKELYTQIVNSAKTNSKALAGKTKHRLLDKEQKKAPLTRATVIVIFAERVNEKLRNRLYDTVCHGIGDETDNVVLPCVVDLESQFCYFDNLTVPMLTGQTPMKNRGIRLLRNYLFDGKSTLADSPDTLDPITDLDIEQSLWEFWRSTKKDWYQDDKKLKQRFENMFHREIVEEDEFLYVKWNNNGILLSVEYPEQPNTVTVDTIDYWDYPKTNKIAQDTVKSLKHLINSHYAQRGYSRREPNPHRSK